MKKIEGVIFDWAGTTVDFGCFAPVHAFISIFRDAGVELTMDEARAPMGMLKRDHIRAILEMPRIGKLWEEKWNAAYQTKDIDALYAEFEPKLLATLADYTEPLPDVLETVTKLRNDGLKIGSTTGYTDSMMRIVSAGAKAKGYAPDCWITPDSTDSLGRPYPYMIFRNMQALRLSAPWTVVKVGDTLSDIREGVQAGVWSVGVIIGSSQLGMSLDEYQGLSSSSKAVAVRSAHNAFLEAGADFTINTLSELPVLIERINCLLQSRIKPGGR